jgi:hypothetical protein
MTKRRSAGVIFLILLAAGAVIARAQVDPAATSRRVSITAGGLASLFQPDFSDDWTDASCGYCEPVAVAGNQPLFGVGAYVDVKLARWVQIEAEGRWQRFNQYDGIHQDNYLIGPRVPVYQFWKGTVYAKALGGFSKMTFDPSGSHGTFTTYAFGGGVDVKMTKRLSLRVPDLEYQYWPSWGNSSISPYGVSVGVGYKIF